MDKYISRRYLAEKIGPVKSLVKIVDNAEDDNLSDAFYNKEEIAFAFAVIAKELGVKIPDNV